MPQHVDSVDKVILSYFHAITRDVFHFKGKIYEPKDLIVSPLIFRGFTCPEHCGGCCPRFTLDYLPSEDKPYDLKERWISFTTVKNGSHSIKIYSDEQTDHNNHHCRNLRHSDGRCGIHGKQPFSCDFELIRAIHYQDKTILTQRLFGRGWNFLRTDGERGARCEMVPTSKESTREVIRKLRRLKYWAEHFKLDHCLDCVIDWAATGSHMKELVIPKEKKHSGFTRPMTEFLEPLVRIQ